MITINSFPKCPKCENGIMLPLQDSGSKEPNAPAVIKGWACSECDNNIFLNMGHLIRKVVETEQLDARPR